MRHNQAFINPDFKTGKIRAKPMKSDQQHSIENIMSLFLFVPSSRYWYTKLRHIYK